MHPLLIILHVFVWLAGNTLCCIGAAVPCDEHCQRYELRLAAEDDSSAERSLFSDAAFDSHVTDTHDYEMVLLQRGMHIDSRSLASEPVSYAEDYYWGFDRIGYPAPNSNGTVRNISISGSQCTLHFNPVALGYALSGKSSFAFNECPQVIASKKIALQCAVQDSKGYNPSIVALPDGLLEFYPSGRWLAVLRTGGGLCPHDNDASAEPKETANSHATHRSYAVVLDSSFGAVAQAEVKMRHGSGILDDAAIADTRVMLLESGDLLIGFTPYALQDLESPWRLTEPLTWWKRECVGILHVSAAFSSQTGRPAVLQAWVDRLETRYLQECPDLGLNAPGPKKNLGFFQHGHSVYALDWIHPTAVGTLQVDQLVPMNSSWHIAPLCFGLLDHTPQTLDVDPWEETRVQHNFFFNKSQIHNGPAPVWIKELNAFLGVGHIVRQDWSGYYNNYYTHQFFALRGQPPFDLVAASLEFCFGSERNPDDCETVQMVTSIVRDGDTILVGFGVMDCEAFVAPLGVNQVLSMLRPVVNDTTMYKSSGL